jgi:hypothetical protein
MAGGDQRRRLRLELRARHPLPQLGIDDGDPRPRMADRVAHGVGTVQRGQRRDDRAQPVAAEVRQRGREALRGIDDDPVAARDAQARERTGIMPREAVELGEGERLASRPPRIVERGTPAAADADVARDRDVGDVELVRHGQPVARAQVLVREARVAERIEVERLGAC